MPRALDKKADQCVDRADVWIFEIDLENVTSERIRSNRAHIKVCSVSDLSTFGVLQWLTYRSLI